MGFLDFFGRGKVILVKPGMLGLKLEPRPWREGCRVGLWFLR